ncbi:MAG: GNAT family N-acetyltransferase [Actinomycetes bacterium]
MNRLTLRPLRPADEPAARRAHEEMAAEGFDFLLGWDGVSTFDDYLDQLDRQERGEGLESWQVPASFRVADVDGDIVGRVHLRHRLNDRLRQEGGHVGFGVLEAHRRRGFARRILQLACQELAALDVDRVLVTCADDNLASRRVIERSGGQLDDLVPRHGGGSTRRYWIVLRA